eukprot:g2321.t1
MDAAKEAISNMGDDGVQKIAKQAEAAMGGGGKAGEGPLAGIDMDKAKQAVEDLGEKGVAEAKAALEKGDIKGAAAGVMENLGGGAGK